MIKFKYERKNEKGSGRGSKMAPSWELPIPVPHPWIFKLLLFHIRYGPNTCSHYTTVLVWHRTYLICDAPLSSTAQAGFAPLKKSGRNQGSCL